jgi:hypothetical protein
MEPRVKQCALNGQEFKSFANYDSTYFEMLLQMTVPSEVTRDACNISILHNWL